MSKKLPSVSGKQVIRVLERFGYEVVRVRGSHHIMSRDGRPSLTVPVHSNRDIAKGTLRSILSDAGITVDDLIANL